MKSKMRAGAMWLVLLRFFNRGVGFISTLILARLLTPTDFGLVALAGILVELTTSLSNLNLDVPIIQRQDLDRTYLDSAWTLQLSIGFLQSLVIVIAAWPIARFFGDMRLLPIVLCLAVVAMMGKLKNIGVVYFHRDMNFNKEFYFLASSRVVSFLVTVSAAFAWRSYWALVMGIFANSVVTLFMSYAMHPFRPRWSRVHWRSIFGFSRWLLVNNLINFFNHKGAEIVLGRMAGVASVGIFNVGYDLSTLPQNELVAPINSAVLPAYSRIHRSIRALRKAYVGVISIIALLAVPSALGIAAIAPLLVPLLLGERWVGAIKVIEYIGLATAISVLLTNTGTVLLALGRPKLLSATIAFRFVLLLPAIVYSARFGVNGVALSYLAVAGIEMFLNLGILLRILRLPLRDVLVSVYRPLLAGTGMYFMVKYIVMPPMMLYSTQNLFLASLATIGAGAVAYMTIIFVLWWAAGLRKGAESYALAVVVSSLRRVLRIRPLRMVAGRSD